MLNQITRLLFNAARASNRARIAGQLLKGQPSPLLRHLRNKAYFRVLGRFLR